VIKDSFMKKEFTIVVFFVIVFFSNINYAQDFKLDPNTATAIPTYLGKVVLIRGEAIRINANNAEEPLRLQDKIMAGDSVKTAEATIVKIKMNLIDDSVFTIGPKSIFQFTESSTTKEKERKTIYKFVSGQLRANFPNKSRPGEIKIEVGDNVSMGIRGTELLANMRTNKDLEKIVQIALLKGEIDINNSATKKITTMLPKEHFISVVDKQNKGLEERKDIMDESLFAMLSSEDRKTFLDFMKSANELKKVQNINEEDETGEGDTASGNAKKNWKQSLKELNQRLKENNH